MSDQPSSSSLVLTTAPLLPGRMRDCALNSQGLMEEPDPWYPCETGGLVAVQAWARYYTTTITDTSYSSTPANSTEGDEREDHHPILILPMGDFKSPLTTLSRFGFGVNALIFHNEFQWRTWTVPAYTLWPNRLAPSTLSAAQSPLFPALISNVVTQPQEHWHEYVKSIHYDGETQLAILYFTKQYLNNTVSQIESTINLLESVRKTNKAQRFCHHNKMQRIRQPPHEEFDSLADFTQTPFSEWWQRHEVSVMAALAQNRTVYIPTQENSEQEEQHGSFGGCYQSVIVFDDKSKTEWTEFYRAMTELLREEASPNNTRKQSLLVPPIAIVDVWGHYAKDQNEQSIVVPFIHSNNSTWLVSYKAKSSDYNQVQFNWRHAENEPNEQRVLESIRLITEDLESLPKAVQTPEYYQDLVSVRQYAREAAFSAIMKEQGTPSHAMPATATADGRRLCYLGECAFGNVVVDALRHLEGADVGFLPSFLFNGPGWSSREIYTLDILENLPYTAQRCGGKLTGLGLLRVLQNSIDKATFGPTDSTSTGGRLLQVSGLQIVYNSQIPKGDHRILSVQVWDERYGRFVPLQKTKLYTFATNTHICKTFSDFPPLLGEEQYEHPEIGEVPGSKSTDVDMKKDVQEYILKQFENSILEPRVEGRLVDEPASSGSPLNWTQRDDCLKRNEHNHTKGEEEHDFYYWHQQILECLFCSNFENVIFSKSRVVLKGQALSNTLIHEKLTITNHGHFPVEISGETLSLPTHIELNITAPSTMLRIRNSTKSQVETWVLPPNELLIIDFCLDTSDRVAGTDTSSLLFSFSDYDQTRGGVCPGTITKFSVVAELSFSVKQNHLGGVAAFGYTSAGLVILTSLSFAAWVARRRKARVVRILQPIFLITLSFGVLLIGASLIPLSIDDGVVSERGCDIACMSKQFLLSQGFIISVAALFCKLLRINKVVEETELFRRNKVEPKDVILPGVIMAVLVFVFMLTWAIAEPMRWERYEVDQQPWNTYGKCTLGGEGAVGRAMGWATVSVCALGFMMTCWQAIKARNISSEFSESRYLGIAIYSWTQLCIVGIPVYFLVDEDDVVVKYSMLVGLILVVCMSMLLVVFVPIVTYNAKSIKNGSSNLIQASLGQGYCLEPSVDRGAMASIPEDSELEVLVGDYNSNSSNTKSPNMSSYQTSWDSPQRSLASPCGGDENATEAKENGKAIVPVSQETQSHLYFPLVVAQRRENRLVSELSDATLKFDSVVEDQKNGETRPLYEGDDDDGTNNSDIEERVEERPLYDDDSVFRNETARGSNNGRGSFRRNKPLYDDEDDEGTEPSSCSLVDVHKEEIGLDIG
mmetsp:Transcript_26119/g.71991  ORF Transcript_26119/g.71991 Transcript_26119/m.71991 type:complete len:1332 (+) Transcript_26119:126-4121(+)